MIEQHESQLILSFPSPEAARAFAQFLAILLPTSQPASAISEPPSDQSPLTDPSPTPASPEPAHSRHVVLTDERQEQLFNQRAAGLTQHQRLLRAQTTLRDGVLPFRALAQSPQPSGQESPRIRAQQEGGFADGRPEVKPARPAVPGVRQSKLRPKS
jgi:hypothetical protein